MKILRTTNSHPDFILLCGELDLELRTRYGKSQSQYDKHNVIDHINTVLVGYLNGEPVCCGCFKPLDKRTIELKRMYVRSKHRRKGLSSQLLHSLEEWGTELIFTVAVLETGRGQPEAINLYRKLGYRQIENYGPYIGIENSVCMRKSLSK